tara:strand:+ start:15507 stop:16835 length:1329 start_codon:yes stop_codon:yes gene_type:complete
LIGETHGSAPVYDEAGEGIATDHFRSASQSSGFTFRVGDASRQALSFPDTSRRSLFAPRPDVDGTAPTLFPWANGDDPTPPSMAGNRSGLTAPEVDFNDRERALRADQAALTRRSTELTDREAALARREAAFANIVDRELAVSRRQEELDVREATLQSREDQLAQLEAGKEKLQRVYQHLTAREVSLNCREAVFAGQERRDMALQQREASLLCREADLHRHADTFRELEQRETTLCRREAAVATDLHKLQAEESQLHQQAQNQQTHLLALELPLQRRAAEVSARETAVRDTERQLQVREAQLQQQANDQQRYLSDRDRVLRRRLAEISDREIAVRDIERQRDAQTHAGDDASSKPISQSDDGSGVKMLEAESAGLKLEVGSSRQGATDLERQPEGNAPKDTPMHMRNEALRQQGRVCASTLPVDNTNVASKMPGGYESDEEL